jgi:hypothetical protein
VTNTLALDSGGLTQSTNVITTAAYSQTGGLFTGDSTSPGAKDITVSGNFALSGGTFTSTSGTVDISGALNQSGGTFTGSDGTVNVSGTFNQSGGTFTGSSGTVKMFDAFNLSGGTFTEGTGTIYINGDMTVSGSPTFNKNASGLMVFRAGGAQKLTSGNQNLGNIQISSNKGDTTLTIQDALTADGVTIDAGQTFDISGRTLTLTGTGTPLVANGTFTDANSTVVYSGSGAATYVTTLPYYNLSFSPSAAATYSLTGNLTGANAVTGAITIGANATVDVTTNNYNIALSGNWSNSGTLTARSGTVTLNGTTQTISGSTTFNNLTIDKTNSPTIRFTSGATQTIAGDFTATGDATHPITITATGASPATLSKASGTVSVSYCTISYSSATGGAAWLAYTSNGNVNSGNNGGWIFTPPYYWVTGGNGNWSSAGNWSLSSGGASGAGVPTSSDGVMFDGNSGSGTSTVDTGFGGSLIYMTTSSYCSCEESYGKRCSDARIRDIESGR